MAKRSEKKSKKRGGEDDEQAPKITPETRRGILIVAIFVLAFLSVLSFFDLAGELGGVLQKVLSVIFGWGMYVFPIVLAGLGYTYLSEKYRMTPVNYIGLVLFILSYSGIIHLFVGMDQATQAVAEGEGGGYLGLALSYPFQKVMGFWASLIVLIALLVVSILIMFNTSLENLIAKSNLLRRGLGRWQGFFYHLRARFGKTRADGVGSDQEEFIKKELEIEQTPEAVLEEKPEESEPGKPKTRKQLEMFSAPKLVPSRKKIDLPLDLLNGKTEKPTSGDIDLNKEKIKNTLQNFGIEVEMGEVNVGPTVTQFTLKPAQGVKLSQITTLQNDIALTLAAHPIRIEAPIPGQSLVGVEVPNKTVAVVTLKEILKSEDFKNRKSNLTIALGRDVAGRSYFADLDPMPHLLIGGATGSGKSVCINSIILSLLYQNNPDDLKFILVDPKRVEMTVYNDIPHLLTPVITEVDKTVNALKWIVAEMDRRFKLLSRGGHRNIQVYNAKSGDRLPYLVLIIDELADLMSVAAAEVEGAIIRLAQMARAVGIHLIVATQRPSVDVITGLIKANITARSAFNVASIVDSRTILDFGGAEKLLGKGDMLFISANLSKPKRLQGAYIDDSEIERVSGFLKSKAKPDYEETVVEKQTANFQGGDYGDLEEDEELLSEAREIILQAGKASASLLQRRLRIGYARAARILDILEEQGFIGPADGAKPREVLKIDEEVVLGKSSDEVIEEDEDNEEDL